MYDIQSLEIPNTDKKLVVGNKVKLGRFQSKIWEVCYGWYSWAYNRPVCGWYLVNSKDPSDLKPLQLTDFDDIIFVQM